MDGAGQTEKNKMVRKENFISSLRIYYKQCQILKMRKDSGSRQPAVTVTRRATGEPLARAGGPRRGADQRVQNRGPRATPPTGRPESQDEHRPSHAAALVQARRGHGCGGARGRGVPGDPRAGHRAPPKCKGQASGPACRLPGLRSWASGQGRPAVLATGRRPLGWPARPAPGTLQAQGKAGAR